MNVNKYDLGAQMNNLKDLSFEYTGHIRYYKQKDDIYFSNKPKLSLKSVISIKNESEPLQ